MRKKKDVFDYVNPLTKRYVKPVVDFISKKPIYSILLLFVIVYFMFFLGSIIISVLSVTFLILIGGVSKIYQRYTTMPLGMELVMFSTVLAGYIYGPLIGGFVGFASFTLATIFSTRYNAVYVSASLVIYTLAGAMTPFFGNITIAGLVFSLVFAVALSFISLAFLLSRPHRVLMFAFTSISWNVWVFVSLVPRIINYLS